MWKDLPSDCFYEYGNGNNLKYKTEVEDPCQKFSGQRSSGNIALKEKFNNYKLSWWNVIF